MEFDVKVRHGIGGLVEIIDLSRDCGEYYEEESEFIPTVDKFKYSHCSTINVVTKVTTDKLELIDAFITDHVEDPNSNDGYMYPLLDDVASFTLSSDGYYQVVHLVLPNSNWIENMVNYYGTEDFVDEPNFVIYCVIDNKLQIYDKGKYYDAKISELIVDLEPLRTNIQKVSVNLFYLGFLQECYMDYCKSLFDKMMAHCKPKCTPVNSDEDKFARDFLWMTINIIKYLVLFEQFLEAQRILEQINYCGGFCKNVKQKSGCGCGCNTRPIGCGCGKA